MGPEGRKVLTSIISITWNKALEMGRTVLMTKTSFRTKRTSILYDRMLYTMPTKIPPEHLKNISIPIKITVSLL